MGLGPRDYAHQDIGNLFESDPLVPERFYSTLAKNRYADPERRLIAAVLEDVVACLSIDPRHSTRRQRRDFHDAKNWINAPEDSERVFSFINICEALGINPGYLRRGLNQLVVTCGVRTSEAPRFGSYRAGVRHKHFRLRG